jgi:hypothetical protein
VPLSRFWARNDTKNSEYHYLMSANDALVGLKRIDLLIKLELASRQKLNRGK